MEQDTDEALMGIIASGDRRAYERLVARYARRAHAVAWRMLGNASEAEDIVQESFIKVWVNAPAWKREKAKFSTWFYRLLTNACIDLRRKKPFVALDETHEQADTDASAEEQLQQKQQAGFVARAIAQLPERQRTALILCYYEELSNNHAAEVMGVHIKALEALLVRARATLRESLAPLAQHDKVAI